MSDLSIFDASSQAAPTSVLDASTIDKNLRAVHAVESGWKLPALPDDVKLDLASLPGVTPDHIQSLLYGLDADFNGNQDAQTVPLYQAPPLAPFSGYDRLRRVVTDVATNKPASQVDRNSIERWKMAAIDGGYLDAPADGKIDNTWSSDFESIRKSMAYDQVNAQHRGDHIGAVPFSKIVEQIGKWTLPSGLLGAATDLDLWWDFGAVGHEMSTWGDKWRKVGKSSGPLDFAKNLVDAITGPIDDIIMPIANWALLASGVSEAYNFGRIAYAGREAFAGAEAVAGLYKSSGVLVKGYDAVTDVKRMTEASGLALRFGRSEKAVVSTLGDAMTGWRNLEHVAPAKKLLQTGMKFGLASQAEDLLPGYQGGKSLTDAMGGTPTWAQTNPLLVAGKTVADLFFIPYATFRPGTFSGGAKGAVSFVGKHLGSVDGKLVAGAFLGAGAGGALGDDTGDVLKGAAFGAVGLAAVPGIGKGLATLASAADGSTIASKIMPKSVGLVGDFLQHTSWKAISGNQNLTMAFHDGMLRTLTGDALAGYNDTFNKEGFLGAFAKHFGVDEEAAGAAMAYTTVAASIDHIASSQSAGNKALYHLSRNKLIAQIRSFDLENVGAHTLDEIAMSASIGVAGQKKEFASLRKVFADDPGKALEYANAHNKQATETLQQLLSVESVPDLDPNVAAGLFKWNAMDAAERTGVIKNYMPQVMDTFGNWPQFTARTSEIRGLLHDGLLDDAVFDTYKLPSGLERPTRAAKKIPVTVHPTTSQEVSQEINNLAFRTPETDITKMTSTGKLDVLARGVDPSVGRFTVMRAENADEGQVRAILAELTELRDVHKTAMTRMNFLDTATREHGELTNLSRKQFSAIVEAGVKGASGQKETRRLFDYAKRQGMSLTDVKRYFDDALDTAVNDPRLTEWLGLSTIQRGKAAEGDALGAVLYGPEALSARIGEVQKKAQFTAARIDGGKLVESLRLPETAGSGVAELDSFNNLVSKVHGPDVGGDLAAVKLSHTLTEQDQVAVDDLISALLRHPETTAAERKSLARTRALNDNREFNPWGPQYQDGAPVVHQRYQFEVESEPLWNDLVDMSHRVAKQGKSVGRDTPESLRMQNHLDSLERDGYKLVHGVEFMMPEDLAHHTPIFQDITRRHMNAVTLGNFFKGRLPAVARANEERKHLAIIQDEMSKIGRDVPLNDADVTNLRDDLTSILRSKQALSEQVRTDAQHGTWMAKRMAGVKTSTTPMSLADLGRSDWRDVIHKLEPVYGSEIANAAPKMLRRMRNTDFKDVGLYAIESHFRTRNQLASGLKVLSGTEHGESFAAHGTVARRVGALAGGVYGAETSDNNTTGFLKGAAIGAAAGTVLQGGMSPLFQKAEKAFEASKWFQYGYLADNLAGLRDTMRFTLSPFFDLSRMAKSQELGQTAAPLRNSLGERVVMPLDSSPKALKKSWIKAGATPREAERRFDTAVAKFQAVARGDSAAMEGDFVAADNLSNYFQQVGILGHNPAHWMVTAFDHLESQGFAPKEAYQAARNMYTYGTGSGRSAAEMSVNVIFFPFSFEKKVYTYLGKYLSEDMSRAVMLHDAYKGYELLDSKYNLKQMWKEHLPALEKLQQLNMFAYGASLGKLGGLNRPFIEPMVNMAINSHGKGDFSHGILNLFNPQGISVRSAADAADVKKLVRSLTPVYNDINYLLSDSAEQAHALMSPSHQTYSADARDGWQEWNDYRSGFVADLQKKGFTMTDLNKPYMASTKLAYEAKRAEIAQHYPGWGVSRKKAAAKTATQKIELADRFDRVANGTGSVTDNLTVQFDEAVKSAKADMTRHGIDEWVDAPVETRQTLIDMATGFAKVNQEFRNVYGKFYGRDLGPIETEVLV